MKAIDLIRWLPSRLAMPGLLSLALLAGIGEPTALAQRGDRDRGRYNPTDILPRIDDNDDGVIEPQEVSDRSRQFYERMVTEAGMDPAKPIVIKQLVERIERNRQQEQRQQADQERREVLLGGFKIDAEPLAAVPGFGESNEVAVPSGFGPPAADLLPLEQLYTKRLLQEVNDIFKRYDSNNDGRLDAAEQKNVRWSSDPKKSDLNSDGILDRREMAERLAKRWGDSARVSPSDQAPQATAGDKKSADSSAKIRTYANSLLKQYDANKNGVLEKGEWSKMSGSPEKADTNRDGIVTLDELTNRLADYSRGGGRSDRDKSSRSGSSRGYYQARSENNRDDDAPSGSGRFLSPQERLPKGIPDWFVRSDANQDGQIAMHEYASTWSDAKVAEFERLDADGNGRITSDEALPR